MKLIIASGLGSVYSSVNVEALAALMSALIAVRLLFHSLLSTGKLVCG